jgi:DNA polymerase III delta prime subunit
MIGMGNYRRTLISPLIRSGIDVVRNKIKTFAQKKVTLPPGRHKIIILDEADR